MPKLKQLILASAATAAIASIPIAPAEAGIHGGHFHPWLLGHGVVGAVLGLATLPLAIVSSVVDSAESQGPAPQPYNAPAPAYYPRTPGYYAAPQIGYAPRPYYAPQPYSAPRPYYAPRGYYSSRPNYYAPRPNYSGGYGAGRGPYRSGGGHGYPHR